MHHQKDHLTHIAEILNDQQLHDGTSIGNQLNITRAAVWKNIQKLINYGIPIQSQQGKGYLLEDPLILLDTKKIKTLLKGQNGQTVHLDVLEKIDSTNDYLKKNLKHLKRSKQQKSTTRAPSPPVCIAETQTAGKGRLDRAWHSPFGQNIYFSLAYAFKKEMSELSGLSLIIGLAVCQAIEATCHLPEPLQVKWPNDIMANNKKLAGILIEVQGESHGGCQVIIGIGINANMQSAAKQQIGQDWTSLREQTGQYQDRNALCATLIKTILEYLTQFTSQGFQSFAKEWEKRDYLAQKPLRLNVHNSQFSGIAAGINEQGHLLMLLPDATKRAFAAGDTTLMK